MQFLKNIFIQPCLSCQEMGIEEGSKFVLKNIFQYIAVPLYLRNSFDDFHALEDRKVLIIDRNVLSFFVNAIGVLKFMKISEFQ